jgi:hypothetical protein
MTDEERRLLNHTARLLLVVGGFALLVWGQNWPTALGLVLLLSNISACWKTSA